MEECWLTKPYDLPDSVLELEEVTQVDVDVVRFLSLCVRGHSTPPLLGLHTESIAREQETANKNIN